MPFVVILGAGPLGGALAYALASRGRFDEVRLIDQEKTLAAGKALDILQSAPVDGCSTRVKGSASLEEAEGAWVAMLADPVNPDPLAHLAALHLRSPGANGRGAALEASLEASGAELNVHSLLHLRGE